MLKCMREIQCVCGLAFGSVFAWVNGSWIMRRFRFSIFSYQIVDFSDIIQVHLGVDGFPDQSAMALS